jgi:predicted nuclease of predicted toxin-antitoxin system
LFPEILADESVDFGIIRSLREEGYTIVSIVECSPGIGDRQVLEVARKRNLLLVTEDSDFGGLIFSFKEKALGVIFLRYHFSERDLIARRPSNLIKRSGPELIDTFTVVTPTKIRSREHF